MVTLHKNRLTQISTKLGFAIAFGLLISGCSSQPVDSEKSDESQSDKQSGAVEAPGGELGADMAGEPVTQDSNQAVPEPPPELTGDSTPTADAPSAENASQSDAANPPADVAAANTEATPPSDGDAGAIAKTDTPVSPDTTESPAVGEQEGTWAVDTGPDKLADKPADQSANQSANQSADQAGDATAGNQASSGNPSDASSTQPVATGDSDANPKIPDQPVITGSKKANLNAVGANLSKDSSRLPAQTSDSPDKVEVIEGSNPEIWVDYTLKPGDTLMKIAFNVYGNVYEWKKIYEINKDRIRDPNRPEPGTKIRIRAPEEKVAIDKNGHPYLIKWGDTLGVISNDVYGTKRKWQRLWENNKQLIRDPNKIYAGFYLYYTMTKQDKIEKQNYKSPRQKTPALLGDYNFGGPGFEAQKLNQAKPTIDNQLRSPASVKEKGPMQASDPAKPNFYGPVPPSAGKVF